MGSEMCIRDRTRAGLGSYASPGSTSDQWKERRGAPRTLMRAEGWDDGDDTSPSQKKSLSRVLIG